MQPRGKTKGIQSLEIGFRVLTAIQEAQGPVNLTRIAERAGLSASAAHNYLTSFVRVGMVSSNARGSYQLGPSLAALGLSAVRSVDHFDVVREAATQLSDRTGLGVAVLSWSPQGPVIVFHRAQVRGQIFSLRNGLVSLLGTAGGHIFVAYRPLEETLPLAMTERRAEAADRALWQGRLAAIQDRVHAAGYAEVALEAIPGYTALSAPVQDENGEVVFALTLTAPLTLIDARPDGEHVPVLLASTRELSRRLGAPR